ncbi:MAG: T9SS type A sorting domain-containing protein [Candidatus Kerfeldbacteria bacterium]|nr:T9SS type A sorting domain-containing protein [Candidatus Kerfeldbacteria bacterium]
MIVGAVSVPSVVFGGSDVALSNTVPTSEISLQSSGIVMTATESDSTNSVNLSWTAPADDSGNMASGSCAVFDLRYSFNVITSLNWDLATPVAGEPIPADPGTRQSMLVTGLTPGTTYYWAIKSADEVYNWSGLSNVVMRGTKHVPVTGGIYRAGKGDFNSDGLGDLVLRDTLTGDVWIALGNGHNQFFPVHGPGYQGSMFANGWLPGVGPYREYYADFSRDGYCDMLLVDLSNGALYVAFNWIAPGQPHFEVARSPYPNNAWMPSGWGEYPYYLMVDDYSHDGLIDVCVFHPIYGRLFVAYNAGNHFVPAFGTSTGKSWITNWNAGSRGSYIPFSGDVSGDGYPDVFALQTSNGRWTGLYNYAVPEPPKFVIAKGKYINYSWIASGWGQAPYVSFLDEYNGDSLKEVSCWHPPLGAIFITEKVGNEFRPKFGPHAGGAMLIGWKAGLNFSVLSTDFSGDNYADYVQADLTAGEWWMAFNWGTEFRVVNGAAGGGAVLRNWGIQAVGSSAKIAEMDESDTLQAVSEQPESVQLKQNYPNPFNPTTTISFSLPETAEVTLSVYNVTGQRVAVLVDHQVLAAGTHSIEWDASGKATGVYIYHLISGSVTRSDKMLLLK